MKYLTSEEEKKRQTIMEGGCGCKKCGKYILSRTNLSKNFYAGPVCLCFDPEPDMRETIYRSGDLANIMKAIQQLSRIKHSYD